LNAVGFEWNPLDANWHCNYEALKAFQKQNNHCNIPFRYQKNKCLVDWVTTQRQDYKNNRLSENKIKLLNAIGFEWKPLDTI